MSDVVANADSGGNQRMAQAGRLKGGGPFDKFRKGIFGPFIGIPGQRNQRLHFAEHVEPGADDMTMGCPPAAPRRAPPCSGYISSTNNGRQQGIAAGLDEIDEGGEFRQGAGRRVGMRGQPGNQSLQRRGIEALFFNPAQQRGQTLEVFVRTLDAGDGCSNRISERVSDPEFRHGHTEQGEAHSPHRPREDTPPRPGSRGGVLSTVSTDGRADWGPAPNRSAFPGSGRSSAPPPRIPRSSRRSSRLRRSPMLACRSRRVSTAAGASSHCARTSSPIGVRAAHSKSYKPPLPKRSRSPP